MDIAFTPAYEEFREEVRAFLAAHWPPAPDAARDAAERGFRAAATEAGYFYRGIPRRYGGSKQPSDILKAEIVREEFAAARAPGEIGGNGTQLLIPTLLDHGTEWQKERFIAPTLRGDLVWAQGYSEPGAGSDLASLRTRAVLDGEHWVINGQKVWSSHADKSDYMFALVRTEPEAPRHDGISYLLIDMRQPGVTVRKLKQMTGEDRFCEVFFDDATTPADWIVGERGRGWQVSRSTLKHERSAIGGIDRIEAPFNRLVALARRELRDGRPVLDDPDVRNRLAMLAGQVAALKWSSYRQMSSDLRGESTGLLSLLFKLYGTNVNHDIARLARDVIDEDFLLAPPQERVGTRRGSNAGSPGPERWNNQFMGSLGIAIAGGASNIQRNIIAERGLGLPRGSAA